MDGLEHHRRRRLASCFGSWRLFVDAQRVLREKECLRRVFLGWTKRVRARRATSHAVALGDCFHSLVLCDRALGRLRTYRRSFSLPTPDSHLDRCMRRCFARWSAQHRRRVDRFRRDLRRNFLELRYALFQLRENLRRIRRRDESLRRAIPARLTRWKVARAMGNVYTSESRLSSIQAS